MMQNLFGEQSEEEEEEEVESEHESNRQPGYASVSIPELFLNRNFTDYTVSILIWNYNVPLFCVFLQLELVNWPKPQTLGYRLQADV